MVIQLINQMELPLTRYSCMNKFNKTGMKTAIAGRYMYFPGIRINGSSPAGENSYKNRIFLSSLRTFLKEYNLLSQGANHFL